MDIGGLITLIAVAFGALGVLGIALTFSLASQGRPVRSGVMLALVGFVVGGILFLVSLGVLVVGPTEQAVVFNSLTGELEQPRRSGFHIIIPGIQTVTIYPISQQNYTMSDSSDEGNVIGSDAVRARSVDGQEVRVDVTVIFRIDASGDNINIVHRDWSNVPGGYTDGLIRPTIRSIVRDVVATFEAEQIYGVDRTTMQAEIDRRLTEVLEPQGFFVSDVLVRDLNFSAQFTDAIERKQIEEQELQRAQTEAQRVRTQAEGRANAVIEEARGEAEAVLIRAQADAEALRLISEQIGANPNLIPYTYIENLSDNVEIVLLPSNSPFLFDLDSFTALGEGFVAPEVPQIIPTDTPDDTSDGG